MQSILLMSWLLINCNTIPYVRTTLVQTISTLIHSTRKLSFYYNSSFLTLSIYVTPTKHLNHFISCTFTSLLWALFIPLVFAPYNAVGKMSPPYWHYFTFIQSSLLLDALVSVLYTLYTSRISVPHQFLHPPTAASCTMSTLKSTSSIVTSVAWCFSWSTWNLWPRDPMFDSGQQTVHRTVLASNHGS